MSRRHLILGAAVGYGWDRVRSFVVSARSHVTGADIVLLVGAMDDELRARLREHEVRTLRVWQPFEVLPRFLASQRFNRLRIGWFHRLLPAVILGSPLSRRSRLRLLCRVMTHFHHVACSRYFHFWLHLQQYSTQYDRVMLSDVRDVLFQADPFGAPHPDGGVVFLEASSTHGQDSGNDLWIALGYGDEGLAELRGKRVSCSGVTLASAETMLAYLERMTCEISLRTCRFAGCDGVDQGVHNWLFWTGRLPEFRGLENFQGPVLTMHGMPPDLIRLDEHGRLVGPEGAAIPVIHQYDRFPAVAARLLGTPPVA